MTSAGYENNLVFAANADFSGADNPEISNGLQLDGDLWIGSTTPNAQGTNINVGTITSTGGSIAVTYDSPNINLETTSSGGGGPLLLTYTASDFDVLDSNFAALIQDNGTTVRVLVRAFDDTTEEFVNFRFQLPDDLDTAGTVTFTASMYAATAAADRFVQLRFGHLALADSDSWDGSYLAEDSGDIEVDANQDDITIADWSETVTNLVWSAGDVIIARLSRIAPTGTNLTGDLNLLTFSIEIPRS